MFTPSALAEAAVASRTGLELLEPLVVQQHEVLHLEHLLLELRVLPGEVRVGRGRRRRRRLARVVAEEEVARAQLEGVDGVGVNNIANVPNVGVNNVGEYDDDEDELAVNDDGDGCCLLCAASVEECGCSAQAKKDQLLAELEADEVKLKKGKFFGLF